MSSLKEIKSRIASIQSTQKITSAMRMIASAKLHRTQGMTENFLRYMEQLRSILNDLVCASIDDDVDMPVEEEKKKSVLLIPMASNSGLCGAFNSNLSKATFKRINEWKARGTDLQLLPIGKKIYHELKKDNQPSITDYVTLMEKVEKGDPFEAVSQLTAHVLQLYQKGSIDTVEFVFHHFKSMGSQVVTVKELVLAPPKVGKVEADNPFLTEPSAEELIQALHPRLLNAEVYGTLLDSFTSEHAARMLAMQTADDNANDLLKELTLLYNKTRQQAITNELIDIMGGKVEQ
ncbi:MAG: ATP synthase F1 subunit gamma [Bacteroidaceae bacterium]|nr:ATP synthase F1 subunit gamma [Bacteroidaceae bacterium]